MPVENPDLRPVHTVGVTRTVINACLNQSRASRARFCRGDQSIREWEKSVAGDRAAFERKPSLVRFPNRNARRIDARHLACANSKCPVGLGVNDRV